MKIKKSIFATPAAAKAVPVKPSTAAIKATTKKINAQRNIFILRFEIGLGVTRHRWFSQKKKINSTARSLQDDQVQCHTVELVFYGRSSVSDS